MLENSLLLIFIPTWFFISISPGMCMTLALSLGMSIGLRRTFFMMWGELLGVATVAISGVLGVTAILLKYPDIFAILKWVGGAYLIYIGLQMWRNKGSLSLNLSCADQKQLSFSKLFSKGYLTAVANPKGWAFTASILPPFIVKNQELIPQLFTLTIVILILELICMTLYASGGHGLKKVLNNTKNVKYLNRISGTLMMLVGLWLALG